MKVIILLVPILIAFILPLIREAFVICCDLSEKIKGVDNTVSDKERYCSDNIPRFAVIRTDFSGLQNIKNCKEGTVAILSDVTPYRTFIFLNNVWTELLTENSEDKTEPDNLGRFALTNCENCGAPLTYSHHPQIVKCEYCGSEYLIK